VINILQGSIAGAPI